MTATIVFPVLLGLLVILGAVYFLLGRNDRVRAGPAEGVPRQAQREERWIPCEIAARIFNPRDLEFVRRQGTPEALALFLAERKRLALLWLGQVRRQSAQVMEAHAKKARMSAHLDALTEARIASAYCVFRAACALVWLTIHLLGPFTLWSLARYADHLSWRLGRIAEFPGAALAGSPVSRHGGGGHP